MKKMKIYDPAMCCSTGVCGPSVDENLLRVSTVINKLERQGIEIVRYNLSSDPQAFIDNKLVNDLLVTEGVEILPVTIVEGEIIKTKEYPTNNEFLELLEISKEYLD